MAEPEETLQKILGDLFFEGCLTGLAGASTASNTYEITREQELKKATDRLNTYFSKLADEIIGRKSHTLKEIIGPAYYLAQEMVNQKIDQQRKAVKDRLLGKGK